MKLNNYCFSFVYLFVLCLLFLFTTPLYAQQKKSIKKASVFVKGRAHKDRILLRWAVNEPRAWLLTNRYGFIIERYTIIKNGTVNKKMEKKVLTTTPLKPKPLIAWSEITQRNDDAAIIAQGLFGGRFNVTSGENKLAKIVNQNDEINQRFTFSLLAADRNFEAAQMAGLAIIDSTVQNGEKYLYRIYTAVPNDVYKIDTAVVYIGTADYDSLPKPKDLNGIYGDKSVMLSWDYKLLKDVYSIYFVERSENGINYSKRSNLPVANLNEKDDYSPSRIFYTDTLEENNRNYYYRVVGLTAFGEIGPPSDAINGQGKQLITIVPNIVDATIVNDSTVNLDWEFATEGNLLIDRFELNQSLDASEQSFKTVVDRIDPTKRSITFYKLHPTNYFTITAVDKYGNKRSSFPYLVQTVDTIPPAKPSGLTAIIDSLGNVTLNWNSNTESDLLGYKILKSNLKEEEGAVLNNEPNTSNIYKEKINLNTLNSKVFYSVIALDNRMNQSMPSELVELVKPDVIPPTSPVFKTYSFTEDGKVYLEWINSSSEDVAAQKLYRQKSNEPDWQLIQNFNDTKINHFKDDSVYNNSIYAYTLVAVDRSKNESKPSQPIIIEVNNSASIPSVKNLKAFLNKQANLIYISWEFQHSDVVEFMVYRAINKNSYTLWKVLEANQNSIEDTDLSVSNIYHYGIRAVLKNGKMSAWKEVKVEY